MTKKIALFLPSLADGGAERVMLNIALGIAEKPGVEVDIVLVRAEGPYLEQAVRGGIHVTDLGCRRIATSVPALIRYLRRERPDALLSALDTTNLVALAAGAVARVGTRMVVSVHCNFTSALAGARNSRAKLLPSLVSRCYPHADAIIAVSEGVADDLSSTTGLSRGSISVIVNPVITPNVVELASAEPDHPWFHDGGSPVVLGIGRLTYQKNFSLLIEAFSRLVSEGRRERLVILGDGDEREELLGQVRSRGLQERVDLPGFLSNPYALMREATVFALSSRYEGLPTVLIEALYCGARVVSTDCPSGPREILRGGELGALVPSENVEALVEALSRALDEDEDARTVDPGELDAYRLRTVVDRYAAMLLPE